MTSIGAGFAAWFGRKREVHTMTFDKRRTDSNSWMVDDICRYSSVGLKYIFCFARLVVSMGVSAVREGRPYHVFVFNNLYASFFQAILATAA